MIVTKIGVEDVPEITRMAKQFESVTSFVKVDVEHSIKTYTKFIESGIGVMFALRDGGKIVGGLGAIKAPDLHTGVLIAVECFWFVSEGCRGHGLKLLAAFEEWGVQEGCSKAAMIHLEDSFPESLEKLYKRRGYRLAERHYLKELV